MRGRQHKRARMRIELLQGDAALKTGYDDSRLARGGFDGARVGIAIKTSDEREFPAARTSTRECLNEIELALLGHHPADLQEISPGRQAESLQVLDANLRHRRGHTIWNQLGRAAI